MRSEDAQGSWGPLAGGFLASPSILLAPRASCMDCARIAARAGLLRRSRAQEGNDDAIGQLVRIDRPGLLAGAVERCVGKPAAVATPAHDLVDRKRIWPRSIPGSITSCVDDGLPGACAQESEPSTSSSLPGRGSGARGRRPTAPAGHLASRRLTRRGAKRPRTRRVARPPRERGPVRELLQSWIARFAEGSSGGCSGRRGPPAEAAARCAA